MVDAAVRAQGSTRDQNQLRLFWKHACLVRSQMKSAPPQGGRAREVAGHSFRTLAPVPQPSTTHAPPLVLRQPSPQPPAACAALAAARTEVARSITCKIFITAR